MTEQIQAVENSTVKLPFNFDEIVNIITCFPFNLFNELGECDQFNLIKLFCKVNSNDSEYDANDEIIEEIINKVKEVYENRRITDGEPPKIALSKKYLTGLSQFVSYIPYRCYISMPEQDKMELVSILSNIVPNCLSWSTKYSGSEFVVKNNAILEVYAKKQPELERLHELVGNIIVECHYSLISNKKSESIVSKGDEEAWHQLIDEVWNEVCKERNDVKKYINETSGCSECLFYQLKSNHPYSYFEVTKNDIKEIIKRTRSSK